MSFRLPTEAEYEYACRAGSSTTFHWGDDPGGTLFDTYGWFAGNAGGLTRAVGQKLPNGFGLFDMAGNLYEICRDWAGPYDTGQPIATNPAGPPAGTYRVMRGSAWLDPVLNGSGARAAFLPGSGAFNLGFRLVLGP